MSVDNVLIKSYKNGFRLVLNETAPFEDILKEIGAKFAEGKQFFGKATVVLSLDGRELSEAEEIQIIETIKMNCFLDVLCVVGRDEDTNKHFIKALAHMEKKMKDDDSGLFYRGSLINGQVLEVTESVVILGDVNPGCKVISDGNIIVLGGMYGEAVAGCKPKSGADGLREPNFVAALEMNPEALSIGMTQFIPAKKAKWTIKPKIEPKIAKVSEGVVVFEPMTRQSLESLYAF